MKITLSGSAGTGKTSLAMKLADALELPYVEEGMRKRLAAGLDVHDFGPDEQRELIRDLWNEQLQAESACTNGFIADRSSLDYMAFWMHYALHEAHEETEAFFGEMIDHARSYERVILLPHGVFPIEADGIRATDSWLQLRYQGVLEICLRRYTAEEQLLELPAIDGIEKRLDFVLSALQ